MILYFLCFLVILLFETKNSDDFRFFGDLPIVVSALAFDVSVPFYHSSVITFWGEMFGQFEHLRHAAVISLLLQILCCLFYAIVGLFC